MSYTVGVLVFVFGLLLSVMLHEAGHFSTAKLFGMKASRFFVGFGPTLWSFRRGETEYGVKAIPAGGFVKIEGMTSLEEIAPDDEDRAFYKQPAGRRTIVLAAGSVVHFIIAIVLVFGFLAGTGQDPIPHGIQVGSVATCLTASGTGKCTNQTPPAPARGVLKPGDVLISVDGQKITGDGENFVTLLRNHPDRPTTITYQRAGQMRTATITPTPIKVGKRIEGRIGVGTEAHFDNVSVTAAFGRTFDVLGDFVKSTGTAIGGLPHEVAGILEGKPRNPNGAASVVDVARVSGQIASTSGVSVGDRLANLLLLLAELNLFVGIFNLLPLLPLDGGHIGILAFEQARTRVYRLVGRRDPGRVDIMKVLPLTYAVVAVFVALSVVLLYAVITNPIKLQ